MTVLTFCRTRTAIVVTRVFCGKGSYILKSFQNPVHRREIENYRLLQSLRIPTIRVIDATDSALLLEDLNYSPYLPAGGVKRIWTTLLSLKSWQSGTASFTKSDMIMPLNTQTVCTMNRIISRRKISPGLRSNRNRKPAGMGAAATKLRAICPDARQCTKNSDV